MKKTLLLIASIAVLSCAKKKEDNPTPVQQTQTVQPTTVEVRVLDEIGNKIPNASVRLYTKRLTSFGTLGETYEETTISTGTANENGIYKVQCKEGLQLYYTVTSTECMEQTSNYLIDVITPNVNNVITVILKNTSGTLTLLNKTSDPYYIYKDGTLWYTAKAKSDTTVKLKNNTYSIRVLQKDGYWITPTDETVSKTINCGVSETATIN